MTEETKLGCLIWEWCENGNIQEKKILSFETQIEVNTRDLKTLLTPGV